MSQEQNDLLKLVRDNISWYCTALSFSCYYLEGEEFKEYEQKLDILHQAAEDLQSGKTISQEASDIIKDE